MSVGALSKFHAQVPLFEIIFFSSPFLPFALEETLEVETLEVGAGLELTSLEEAFCAALEVFLEEAFLDLELLVPADLDAASFFALAAVFFACLCSFFFAYAHP